MIELGRCKILRNSSTDSISPAHAMSRMRIDLKIVLQMGDSSCDRSPGILLPEHFVQK